MGLANQMDTFVDGKFAHMVDPKDGYPVRDYPEPVVARIHRIHHSPGQANLDDDNDREQNIQGLR